LGRSGSRLLVSLGIRGVLFEFLRGVVEEVRGLDVQRPRQTSQYVERRRLTAGDDIVEVGARHLRKSGQRDDGGLLADDGCAKISREYLPQFLVRTGHLAGS
jgi:hypothetical protein